MAIPFFGLNTIVSFKFLKICESYPTHFLIREIHTYLLSFIFLKHYVFWDSMEFLVKNSLLLAGSVDDGVIYSVRFWHHTLLYDTC